MNSIETVRVLSTFADDQGFARGAPLVKLQLFMRFDDYLHGFSGISNKLKAGASIC